MSASSENIAGAPAATIGAIVFPKIIPPFLISASGLPIKSGLLVPASSQPFSLPGGELRNIGLIVDAVEEVANVATEDIEPPPDFGGAVGVEYLLGMAKVKGVVKSLLDIEKVIADDVIKIPSDQAT
ncbi:MAG: chemotaxis protein CheW [Verrucomicrobia bacterium]|nr:chemotaxis protein CheW [Verrucomicrobiota bacterium]